jgi:hypothetical protein
LETQFVWDILPQFEATTKRTEKFDAALLADIRREVGRLAALDRGAATGDRFALGRLRVQVNDAKKGIVEADFPILLSKPLDSVALKACQRSAARLEAKGAVVRLRRGPEGYRATHFQLVAVGGTGSGGGEKFPRAAKSEILPDSC